MSGFILIWFRLTPATSIALLPDAAPSMISLSTSAPTSGLRLKGAAHFVAIDGSRKGHGNGASL
jgi:hypothetical protein